MLAKVGPYWKAIIAFVAPAAGNLIFAVNDASAGKEQITQGEWIAAVCVSVVASAAVYAKGNKDPQALHQDESVQPPEGKAYIVGEKGPELIYPTEGGQIWDGTKFTNEGPPEA